jgi:hypothetical protein
VHALVNTLHTHLAFSKLCEMVHLEANSCAWRSSFLLKGLWQLEQRIPPEPVCLHYVCHFLCHILHIFVVLFCIEWGQRLMREVDKVKTKTNSASLCSSTETSVLPTCCCFQMLQFADIFLNENSLMTIQNGGHRLFFNFNI